MCYGSCDFLLGHGLNLISTPWLLTPESQGHTHVYAVTGALYTRKKKHTHTHRGPWRAGIVSIYVTHIAHTLVGSLGINGEPSPHTNTYTHKFQHRETSRSFSLPPPKGVGCAVQLKQSVSCLCF